MSLFAFGPFSRTAAKTAQEPATPDAPGSSSGPVPGSDGTLFEILGIATAISGAGDLRSLLHRILRRACALTDADAGSIFLVEKAEPQRFGAPPSPDE
ncbi:MAG: hypothetical protein ACKO5M_08515, partial [Vulcanococcus sp.]